MSRIAVVASPSARAALEMRWVLHRGAADVIADGLCSTHPALSTATPQQRALAIVRALRYTLGEHRVEERTAEVLHTVLAATESTGATDPLWVARELLNGDVDGLLRRHGLAARPGTARPGTAAGLAPYLSALTETPRSVLDHAAGWGSGTRLLHWDRLIATGRDAIVDTDVAAATLGLNLYGLVEAADTARGQVEVLIEDAVPTTVLDEHAAAVVRRLDAADMQALASR